MNYIDIAIIAVIALFALVGIVKGIGKTFIKFVCFAISIVAAYFLADILVKLLLKPDFISKLIVGSGKSLATIYEKSLPALAEGTKVGGILGFYINPMIARFTEMGGVALWGMSCARFVAVNMAMHSLYIVVFFLLYFVVRLVAILIAKLLKKILLREGKQPKSASRLLGFVFGAVRGGVVVVVILIIATIIIPFGFAKPVVNTANKSMIGDFAVKYTYKAVDLAVYGKDTDDTEEMLSWAKIKPLETPTNNETAGGETGGESGGVEPGDEIVGGAIEEGGAGTEGAGTP